MKPLQWLLTTICLAGLVVVTDLPAAAHEDATSAEALARDAQAVQQQAERTAQILQSAAQRLRVADKAMDEFKAVAAVQALDRSADVPAPPDGKAALRLRFQYQPGALPGPGLQVYEAASGADSLWAMEALPPGSAPPRGAPLKDNTLFLAPGEARRVIVVYENPTAQDVGFLVLPHQESPGSLGPQTWLTCLCMAFVYQAPARGAWYRVIQVKAGPDMPAGARVDVLWPVLTDPAAFPTDSLAMAVAAPARAPAAPVIEKGRSLAQRFGCAACHSATGDPRPGPTWKGLYGKRETLADGSTVQVDEAYLRRAIHDPDAEVVKGFPAGMMPPDFGRKMSDKELTAIIAYIKALK